MDGIFTVITVLLGILGGGRAFINWILYRKQQERFKTTAASEKEVIALRAIVKLLQQQVEFYDKQISEMQTLVVNKDEYIIQLTKQSIYSNTYQLSCNENRGLWFIGSRN